MKISKSVTLPLLLAGSTYAAPHIQSDAATRHAQPQAVGEKRQYMEAVNALISAVEWYLGYAKTKEAEERAKGKDEGGYAYNRKVDGRGTDIGCIFGDQKGVDAEFLKNFVKQYCDDLTGAPVNTYVTNKYGNAQVSQEWTVKVTGDFQEKISWKGDWVHVIFGWTPKAMNGELKEISSKVCKELIEVATDVCSWGDPLQTKGFAAVLDTDWDFFLDIIEADDAWSEDLYGSRNPAQDPEYLRKKDE